MFNDLTMNRCVQIPILELVDIVLKIKKFNQYKEDFETSLDLKNIINQDRKFIDEM